MSELQEGFVSLIHMIVLQCSCCKKLLNKHNFRLLQFIPTVQYCILFILCTFQVQAQEPRWNITKEDSVGAQKQITADTCAFEFLPAGDLLERAPGEILIPFDDMNYEDILQTENISVHHGAAGSPAHAITAIDITQNLHSTGIAWWNFYKKEITDLEFSTRKSEYTYVGYQQGPGQSNNHTQAEAKVAFAGGVYGALSYQKYGSDGIYQNQALTNSRFHLGLRWEISKKFQTQLLYLSQAFNEQVNGGVDSSGVEDIFNDPAYQLAITIPVKREKAITREHASGLKWSNLFRIGRDSTSSSLKNYIGLEIEYQVDRFKYSDPFQTANGKDSVFYGDYLNDVRGIRLSVKEKEFSPLLYYRLISDKRLPLDLKGGVAWKHRDEFIEPVRNVFGEWWIQGQCKLQFNKRITLTAGFENAIVSDFPEYQFQTEIKLEPIRGLNIDFNGFLGKTAPGFIYDALYINQLPIWNMEFQTEESKLIHLNISYTPSKSELHLDYHRWSNKITLDANAFAVQTADPITYRSISFTQGVRLGNWYNTWTFTLQEGDQPLYFLPRYAGRWHTYFEKKMFNKKLDFKSGLIGTYIPKYDAAIYWPVLGIHKNETEQLPAFPSLDVYAQFRVQGFTFFARMQNLMPYFTKQTFFSSPGYPIPENILRLGINWQMNN